MLIMWSTHDIAGVVIIFLIVLAVIFICLYEGVWTFPAVGLWVNPNQEPTCPRPSAPAAMSAPVRKVKTTKITPISESKEADIIVYPCFSCGGGDLEFEDKDMEIMGNRYTGNKNFIRVVCGESGCQSAAAWAETMEGAIEKWNEIAKIIDIIKAYGEGGKIG